LRGGGDLGSGLDTPLSLVLRVAALLEVVRVAAVAAGALQIRLDDGAVQEGASTIGVARALRAILEDSGVARGGDDGGGEVVAIAIGAEIEGLTGNPEGRINVDSDAGVDEGEEVGAAEDARNTMEGVGRTEAPDGVDDGL